MSPLLIVNADDHGLSPGVSEGILRAASTGVVSSTTVMANLVEQEDLDALIDCGLPAGAHLNLTCGPPLTGYPKQLLDDRGWFIKQLRNGAPLIENLAAVQQEWTAQIESLRERGLKLTHLDSHHHVHFQPILFELSMMVANHYGVGLRAHGQQSAWAADAGVHSVGRLTLDFFGEGNLGRDQFIRAIGDPADGPQELMCHPGRVDELLRQRSGYLEEREMELEVLGDPGLKSMVEDMGWRLGGYDALAEAHGEVF